MRNLSFNCYPQSISEPVIFHDHTIFSGQESEISIGKHKSSFALVCVLGGRLIVRLNGIEHKLSPAEFLIVNRGSIVEILASRPSCPFVLCFGGDVQFESGWNIAERVHAANDHFVKIVTQLADLRNTCSSFITLRAEAMLRSIISDIAEFSMLAREESFRLDLKKTASREENYKRVAAVRDWIEDHFSEEASLKQLASMAALDPQHFLRLFTQLYAKTPRQYIIDRRIAEAKRLLANPHLTTETICYQVGWQSVPSFTLAFKQKAGVSPGQYREKAKAKS